MQPFSNSDLLAISYCHENFMMISQTVQELLCWQTNGRCRDWNLEDVRPPHTLQCDLSTTACCLKKKQKFHDAVSNGWRVTDRYVDTPLNEHYWKCTTTLRYGSLCSWQTYHLAVLSLFWWYQGAAAVSAREHFKIMEAAAICHSWLWTISIGGADGRIG